jgi:nucleoside-diphosphate-sugar epimerase
MEKNPTLDLRRIVLLGHSGFVGSHLVARLRRHSSDLELGVGSC